MNVFCNGFPKSGNHALQKAVELLGVPAEVNHRPFKEGLPHGATHHVLIVRDPRNVIISWLRFNGDPVTPGKFLARFRKFQDRSLADEMAEYEPWREAHGTYIVRYEQLIEDDRTMREIAAYLGVSYISGSFAALPNHTRTWNPVRSDYRGIWTPEVIAAWGAEGGDELLARWGY